MGTDVARAVVLLGAGSSVEAGVPASVAMTQAIVEAINAGPQRYRMEAHALNYAIGALVAHDTAAGASPYAGIDVERLFSAVQMLSDRRNLEIAPFVGAWGLGLESIGLGEARLPSFFSRHFQAALASDSAFGLERVFEQGVKAVLDRTAPDEVYTRLGKTMLNQLSELVVVAPASVDYLGPLMNITHRPIGLATLNYDRSVEILAQRAGLRVDTGISRWAGDHQWSWDPDADVRLLKLHGSIDWWMVHSEDEGKLSEPRVVSGERPDGWAVSPGVVFGQRGKLQADGPFLAMLAAFERMLSQATELVVVGYSFRDDHVNTAIRRWVNTCPGRMTIVDPGFEQRAQDYRHRGSFAAQMRRLMYRFEDGKDVPVDRFRVVSAVASEGLQMFFGRGPRLSLPDADPAVRGLHGE